MKSAELVQSPAPHVSEEHSYISKVASLIASTSVANSVGSELEQDLISLPPSQGLTTPYQAEMDGKHIGRLNKYSLTSFIATKLNK